MSKTCVLPAAQYDALEAAAQENGGVGAGVMLTNGNCGICAYGLAYQAGVLVPPPLDDLMDMFGEGERGALDRWLYEQSAEGALPFAYWESDIAVERAQAATGRGIDERVPFDAWADALGLSRGE